MNGIRKEISAVRRAGASPPPPTRRGCCPLMISDVRATIRATSPPAPRIGHRGRCGPARLAALGHWGVTPPASVRRFLEARRRPRPARRSTPCPRRERHLRRPPRNRLPAAATLAEAQGYTVECWATPSRARRGEVAAAHAPSPSRPKGPRLILSGGELTVTRPRRRHRRPERAEYATGPRPRAAIRARPSTPSPATRWCRFVPPRWRAP